MADHFNEQSVAIKTEDVSENEAYGGATSYAEDGENEEVYNSDLIEDLDSNQKVTAYPASLTSLLADFGVRGCLIGQRKDGSIFEPGGREHQQEELALILRHI